jgi:phosphohistidine phosphatase
MNLFLLRHGIAAEPGEMSDSERPLTREGRLKLSEVARGLRSLDVSFDMILSSPYVRARDTARLIAKSLNCRELLLEPGLIPGGNPRQIIDRVNARKPRPENVLLVGHEPDLSGLISLLAAGSSGIQVTMKKAGLCKLSLETLKHGRCARLEWLLTPKQLALMAP